MIKEKLLFLCAVEIFILNSTKEKVLLLKRSPKRTVHPDMIAGIGGKMDSNELETPIETAYREIEEETGIIKDEIDTITLRGLVTADDNFGKWNVFEFVAVVKQDIENKEIVQTDEGTLFWCNINNIEEEKLIPDLQNKTLQKLLFDKDFLWIKSYFSKKGDFLYHKII